MQRRIWHSPMERQILLCVGLDVFAFPSRPLCFFAPPAQRERPGVWTRTCNARRLVSYGRIFQLGLCEVSNLPIVDGLRLSLRLGHRLSQQSTSDGCEAMLRIPGMQLRDAHRVRLATERQRLQREFHAVPVSKIADRFQHDRPISPAGLERPEAVDFNEPVGTNDELHPTPARIVGIDERICSAVGVVRNGFHPMQEMIDGRIPRNRAATKHVEAVQRGVDEVP